MRAVTDWRRVRRLVFEYDFEYAPLLSEFYEFMEHLRGHGFTLHHAKVGKPGQTNFMCVSLGLAQNPSV